MTKADPANADKYTAAFNYQLTEMKRAHNQLRYEANQNLNTFLDVKTTTQLQDFENFYADGGQYQIYTTQMKTALLTGVADPTALQTLQMMEQDTNE